ncbi:MAG TPA: response regulator [Bacteroidales bacterium]|nr:response regulator [Bacteroidales bacterium]
MTTVLIAEDDYSNYLYLEELFEGNEVTLIYASNGQEAVEICSKNKDINLVLMDIRMPVMNGYLATKQIKSMRPDLPIVAQTAYGLETEMKGLKADFDDIIFKPINRAIFKHKLSKFIPL